MNRLLYIFFLQLVSFCCTSVKVFAAGVNSSVLFSGSHLSVISGVTTLFFLLIVSYVLILYLKQKKQNKVLSSQRDELEKLYEKASENHLVCELDRLQKKYNEVINTIPAGYVEFSLNGDINNINNTVAEIFHSKREDMIGQHYTKLLSVTKSNDIQELFKTIFKTGRPAQIKNVEVIGKDNIKRIIEISASLITGDNGLPEGFRSIFNDVSKLTEAETNQSLLEERLIRSQQVEAIGTLAGGIAHDFNNLLMAIQGNISILLHKIKKGNSLHEKLINIEACVLSGAELTKQLMGFTPGKNSCITPININELAEETVKTFINTKKNINIIQKYEDDIWYIEADPNQIKQVILNLFINSWQTCSDKRLFIETTNSQLDSGTADSLGLQEGRYVQVIISNSGNIFSDTEFAEDISELKSNINAGIGIVSSSEMIKSYKGLIDFNLLSNDEVSYTIYFPTPEKERSNEIEVVQSGEPSDKTVLFVDDEEMIIDVGKPMLEELGYNVLVARGGEEAIKVYEINKGQIDLVILDMVMPQIDTEQVYEVLKTIDPEIKTILSSGYNLDDQVDRLIQNGCDGFIQKPFNLKRLSNQIKDVLN